MEDTETDGPGQPEFIPNSGDIAWVVKAAAVGLPQEIIRLQIFNPDTGKPIDSKTLRKHFRLQLDTGLAQMGWKLLTTAFEVATDAGHNQCVQMNKFLCQTRLGLKETTVTEIVGEGGAAMGIPQLVIIRGGNTDREELEETDDGTD